MERFALPGALAGDKYIRSDIRRFLDAAEDTQKALWSACSSYARDLLSRGDRKPEGKDISGFVSQMPPIPCYWSTLEAKFHDILQDYTLEKDPDEIELAWLQRGACRAQELMGPASGLGVDGRCLGHPRPGEI